MDRKLTSVNANGRNYGVPARPVVVVCVDGCEPDYITEAIQAGVAPYMKRMIESGRLAGGGLRGAQLHQLEQPVRGASMAQFRHLRPALNHTQATTS